MKRCKKEDVRILADVPVGTLEKRCQLHRQTFPLSNPCHSGPASQHHSAPQICEKEPHFSSRCQHQRSEKLRCLFRSLGSCQTLGDTSDTVGYPSRSAIKFGFSSDIGPPGPPHSVGLLTELWDNVARCLRPMELRVREKELLSGYIYHAWNLTKRWGVKPQIWDEHDIKGI